MTPVTFPLMPAAVALFTGPIFMLYTAKTPKRGALTIMGVIIGILSFASGMFWMMAVFYAVFGVLADLICASGKFKSFKRNLLGYCVFALPPMAGMFLWQFCRSSLTLSWRRRETFPLSPGGH